MKIELLNPLISLADSYDLKSHFYIDKLAVYFDARVSNASVNKLANLSEKNHLTWPCTLEGYSHLSQKLELFQPNEEVLTLLRRTCESKGDYRINYIELALDFYSESMPDVENLTQFFNKHLVRSRKTKDIKNTYYFYRYEKDTTQDSDLAIDEDDGAAYYNPKTDYARLVMYNGKEYRWNPKYACLHLEYRYSGLKQLKKLGIITVKDLITFNHFDHWEKRLDLRKPDFKEIGQHLGKDQDVSATAFNKRGNTFFRKLPILQEYLVDRPEDIKLFSPMNTEESLEKFFKKCF